MKTQPGSITLDEVLMESIDQALALEARQRDFEGCDPAWSRIQDELDAVYRELGWLLVYTVRELSR